MRILDFFLTATTESLAATAKMSAQDTVLGHKFSNWDLMVSITLNPLRELLLGPAVCSPVKVALSFRRTDASQPCYKILLKLVNSFVLKNPTIYLTIWKMLKLLSILVYKIYIMAWQRTWLMSYQPYNK